MQLPLAHNLMWPGNEKGFSVALWLRLEASNPDVAVFTRRARRSCCRASRHMTDHMTESGSTSSAGDECSRRLPLKLRQALRMKARSRQWSPACLHLLSVGDNSLQFEV